jgi:hypothetical protein
MAQKFTEAELKKKPIAELRKLVDEAGYETDGLKKQDLIEAVLEAYKEPVEDDADEVDDEDEVDDTEATDEADDDEELDDEELPEPDAVDDEEDDEVDEEPAKPAKKTRKPKAEKDPAAGDTLAAKQVATILKTEPKTLRQFLRSDASTFEGVGSGGRYEFTDGDIPKIKEEFDKWREGHAARGSKRTAGAKADKAANVVEVEEADEIEELSEQLDEIDDEDLELDE